MKKIGLILALVLLVGLFQPAFVIGEVKAFDGDKIDWGEVMAQEGFNTAVYLASINNDGYVYAIVYSDNPNLNCQTPPILYSHDKTTVISSYNNYVRSTNSDTDEYGFEKLLYRYTYKLNLLDKTQYYIGSYFYIGGIPNALYEASTLDGLAVDDIEPDSFFVDPFEDINPAPDCKPVEPDIPKADIRHRFYNPATGDHVFLATKQEGISAGYLDDKVSVRVATSGTPVYSIWNEISKDHIYTTDRKYGEYIVSQCIGYHFDYNGKPAFYSANPSAGMPVYSMCVPGKTQHVYTTSIWEGIITGYTIEPNGGTKSNPKPAFYFIGFL